MPNLQLLTYLAQVRQQPLRSDTLILLHVLTMLPFLLIPRYKKSGVSHREIVIIGTALGVGWVVQNRSTGVWLKVAGYWLKTTRYILSRSLAGEGK